MNENGAGQAPDATAALGSYLTALRSHPWLVIAVTLIAAVASVAYLRSQGTEYEATAGILVVPVPADDLTFTGLPLLRTGGPDESRPIHTAEEILRSEPAAEIAARRLGAEWTAKRILDAVELEAQPDTSVVEVNASAGTGEHAAEIANAYAAAALEARQAELEPLIDGAISATRRALRSVEDPAGSVADGLRARLSTLQTTVGDPSLSVVSDAAVPSTPTGPPGRLVIGFALVAGFSLGALAAILAELLTPRPVRDERDLASLYPLPVLARIPGSSRTWRGSRKRERANATREGFRSLRSQLALRASDGIPRRERARIGNQRAHAGPGHRRNGFAVLITSPSRGDGRSTATLDLARAAAAGGQQALLIDFDLHGSGVSRVIKQAPPRSLQPLLTGAPPAAALAPVPGIPRARILAMPTDPSPREVEALAPRMAEIITSSRLEAEWVIVDAPPLGGFPDALPILAAVDETVVVVRAGHTPRAALARLGEILDSADASPPAGYLFIAGSTTFAPTRAYDGGELLPGRAGVGSPLAR